MKALSALATFPASLPLSESGLVLLISSAKKAPIFRREFFAQILI